MQRVEEQAEEFFALKQGQKHLKEVGREIALRRFQTDMFGRLKKRDLAQGKKLAREEYISKYSREATREAKAEVERHQHDLQRDLEGITKEHKILSVADERILDWQWERKYDSESGYHFFSCEATGATLWEEPHLPNVHGHCEESGCKERAVIRCPACSEEFCESCDRVIHRCAMYLFKPSTPVDKRFFAALVRRRTTSIEWTFHGKRSTGARKLQMCS